MLAKRVLLSQQFNGRTSSTCEIFRAGSVDLIVLFSSQIAAIATRCFSTEIEKLVAQHNKKFPNLETYSLRRGTGNRSSFNGTVVTVFGANGTFGVALVPALARIGCQVILPYRRNIQQVVSLKPSGDLGQFQFVVSGKAKMILLPQCDLWLIERLFSQPFYLKDEESIHQATKYSNVVINLMSKWNETV